MYVVEMFWGSSGETIVYGQNADGDLVPTKTIKNSEPDPDYRSMRCGGNKWYTLLELGRQYGWEPQGTVPGEKLKKGESFDNNYEPYGYYEFFKKVEAEDAGNWANALERAVKKIDQGDLKLGTISEPKIISASMTKEQLEENSARLDKDYIADFIQFLRNGSFKFSWDD